MTHSPSTTRLGVAFNAFLFADISPIGGARLTVVSALARLDIDPWREAGDLALLSRDQAGQRLARLLMRLPGWDSVALDAQTTSTRLVGLLPAGSDRDGGPPILERLPRASDRLWLMVSVGLGLAMLISVFLSASPPPSADIKTEAATRTTGPGTPAARPRAPVAD